LLSILIAETSSVSPFIFIGGEFRGITPFGVRFSGFSVGFARDLREAFPQVNGDSAIAVPVAGGKYHKPLQAPPCMRMTMINERQFDAGSARRYREGRSMMMRMVIAGLVLGLSVGCGAESQSEVAAADGSLTKTEGATMTTVDIDSIPFETITGDSTSLADYQGKVLLLVNVASECGFTPQYAGLEELYRKFKDSGLVVIGFPANNFGKQEPGTNAEILKFCTSKFDVTFPMMAKISVKGDDKHPLFVQLTEKSPIPGEIEWNFSKFLIDREGNLVARFPSKVKPMSKEIVSAVERLL
jgi:glutathione peroxidase